jgi:hypothetical protein
MVCSAGVSPASLQYWDVRKIAGKMPALQKNLRSTGHVVSGNKIYNLRAMDMDVAQ